jgi:RHS repeat-associated protein
MGVIDIRSTFVTLLSVVCVCASAQTATENYVKTDIAIDGNGGKVTSVEYYDGLGRAVLTVTNGLGNNQNYVYERRRYDYGDLISEQYIRAYGNTQPTYKDSADLNWRYSSDPYKSTRFTYDGLGRVTQVKGPGKLWANNGRYGATSYELNDDSDVRLYKVSGNSLALSGYYSAGTLSVEKMTDEDDHVKRIYRDMQGRTVLERRGSSYDTYYVYDYLGNLRYVLPPLAADALTSTSETWTTSTTTVKRYAYYYEYDSRGRCTKKKLPGCNYVTMTYDENDRLISSQDGNQRNASSPTSTYYEYDALGRQTVMGIEYASGTKIPYCRTFYDDYSFLNGTESARVGFDSSNGYESSYASAKGLQTGCRLLHLDNPSTSEVTAMYYNAYGEMIQKRSTNHLSGNDDEYIQYSHYTGKELYHKHIHSASGQTTHTEVYTYEYDAAGRLQGVKHKLDNNPQVTLSTITYDEIGRVASQGATYSTVTYGYNIRDWVKKIEGTLFKEYIGYNETSGNAIPTNKFYNGNIGAISWRAGSETANRTYQFNYTIQDWLKWASYSGAGGYSTTYTYNKMGNLKSLKRKGKLDNGTYHWIDSLKFTYTGNQVTKIEDSGSDPTYSGAFNFVNGASQADEYTYDKNGNMTKDLNKKISSIQYNFLNLPTIITYSTGKSATYIYNGAGRKLRTSYKASASSTAVPTDYCGNMIYENNVLKQILIDGGYITFSGTTPSYHYYLKDHLGNNRVVVNASGTAEQVNHYYPFGGLFGESTGGSVQRFKYNGKELDRTHGLDWYDYGARHMSPDIGRFTTIDPMAEKYYNISPYAYCLNNPVNKIDEEGESPISAFVKLLAKKSAKKAIITYAKNNIQRRLGRYMSKDMAKQFTKDVDNIVSIMDDSWWEVGLEMIPGFGDVYGAGKFGMKAAKTYERLQKLENTYTKKIIDGLDKEGKKKFKKSMRSKGVKDARRDQKAGIRKGEEAIYEKGNDVEGHHIHPVNHYEDEMTDPRNIKFLHKEEHMKEHRINRE